MPAKFRGPGFVAMAVYRPDPLLLERQIASLARQTASEWECLIGIDGADAGVYDLVSTLTERDQRVHVRQYEANVGVYRHFERLLAEIPDEATWVALADQDDVWHPTKIERLTELLAEPGVTAATCQARLVDPAGRLLGHTDRKPASLVDLILRNQVSGSLAVFAPTVARQAVPFPRSTTESMHDHWLGVCASAMGELRQSEEYLQDYVQHGANVLGEEVVTPWMQALKSVREASGPRAHLNEMAAHQWGWRVSLAQGLADRGLGGSEEDEKFVRTVADGFFSRTVAIRVLRSWRAGRLRKRAVVKILVCAIWFAAHRRTLAETGIPT